MKALAKSFSTNQSIYFNSNYFKGNHGKTKILKIYPLFKNPGNFVTMLLLLISKINDLTRNNTFYHCVTRGIKLRQISLILLRKDQHCPKKGLFSRICGIKECLKSKNIIKKYIFFNLKQTNSYLIPP